MTRKKTAAVGAVLASLALGGVAVADEFGFPPTTASVSGTVAPATVGTPKNPKPVTLKFRTKLNSPAGTIPATVDTATVWFPHGAVANGAIFPSCNARKLELLKGERKGICDNGSLVGHLETLGFYANLKEPIHADIYNANKGKNVLFYFFGDNPVIIRQAVLAKLVKLPDTNLYGYKLSLKLPETLQDPVPGTWASFRDLRATTGATRKIKGKKRGFIEAFYCPLGGQVPVRIDYTFLDGQRATAKSFISCKRK